MRKTIALALAVLLAIAAFGARTSARAQTLSEYFPEFGHFVMGDFLGFYHSVDNPVELFGYPITEAFRTPSGLTVQYFEKARFELHPGEPAESRVRLTPLGDYLHEAGQPLVPINDTAPCRAFGEDGRLVCYDFLEFYESNGGPERFGLPVSNMEMMQGIKVQYFENVRLEWRPGINGSAWIKVANLGREYFFAIGENPRLLDSVVRADNRLQDILRLKARAFPQNSITARKGEQTIYVLISDQRSTPIEAVDVSVVVRWPSGAESRFIATAPTGVDGIARISFPVSSNEIGLVMIQVEGMYNRIPVNTVTSFRIWW